jgi:MYXO-CTERM domain-containing protein
VIRVSIARLTPLALVVVLAGVVAADARACVCAELPLRERLDAADAAVAGRVVAERGDEVNGAPVRILTFEVEQRVKGGVGGTIEVRAPSGTDCDVEVPRNEPIGLLLTEAPDGAWLVTASSVVSAPALVVEGGEPRGGTIKVVVGLVILGLVLLWAARRRRRGARPDLPGAPGA